MFKLQTIWSFAKECTKKDRSSSKMQHGEVRILMHKEFPTFMKVTQKKKKDLQQCVTVVKLTVPSKYTEKMMNAKNS